MGKVVLIAGKKGSGKSFLAGRLLEALRENTNAPVDKAAYADKMKNVVAEIFQVSRETLDVYKNKEDLQLTVFSEDVMPPVLSMVYDFCLTFDLELKQKGRIKKAKKITRNFLEHLPVSNISEKGDGYGVTNIRKALQIFGTEAVKPVFGNNIWGRYLFKKREKYLASSSSVLIVDDWRFPEEKEAALESGNDVITVWISSPNTVSSNDTHASENSIGPEDADVRFFNNMDGKSVGDFIEKMKSVILESYKKEDTLKNIADNAEADMDAVKENEYPFVVREKSPSFDSVQILNWKGKLINPFQLDEEDFVGIGLQLASTLSRIQRFWGQLRENYTVAQHCLAMVEMFEGDRVLQKWAIAHELFEGLGVGDIPSPIKRLLPQILEAEEKALMQFAELHGLPYPIPEEIKKADRGLLVREALTLLPYSKEFDWIANYGEPDGNLYKLGATEHEIKSDFLRKWQELFEEV